jgi:hypothetical protein
MEGMEAELLNKRFFHSKFPKRPRKFFETPTIDTPHPHTPNDGAPPIIFDRTKIIPLRDIEIYHPNRHLDAPPNVDEVPTIEHGARCGL